MEPKIDPDLNQSFIKLVAENVGLAPKNLDRAAVSEKLLIRIKALKLTSPEDYYRLLKTSTRESQKEWQNLITLLTNNETYFFRDQEQIKLLRSQILPELVQRKKDSLSLRICSAGCSTGEEPYSLAILLQELVPNLSQWNSVIFGVDVDETALNRAKQGIYTPWSFRGVGESIKQRYFQQVGNRYHLASEIKQMVNFKPLNLVKDPFPQRTTELRDIDLFICRNVFIYFDSLTITKILEKIYNTLHPQGYFMTGHTELHRQDLSKFQKQVFPESVIYRRQEASLARAKQVSVNSTLVKPLPQKIGKKRSRNVRKAAFKKLSSINSILNEKDRQATINIPRDTKLQEIEKPVLEAVQTLYQQNNYDQAILELEKVLLSQPQNIQACYLMAAAHANLGNHESAIHYCYQALEIDSFFVSPYYLLAQIAEEQGNTEEAKRILKKIIYLVPNCAIAYLDLSQIYQREGDTTRTLKMQQTALDLFKSLPADTKIEEKDMTAAELILQLENAAKNQE